MHMAPRLVSSSKGQCSLPNLFEQGALFKISSACCFKLTKLTD